MWSDMLGMCMCVSVQEAASGDSPCWPSLRLGRGRADAERAGRRCRTAGWGGDVGRWMPRSTVAGWRLIEQEVSWLCLGCLTCSPCADTLLEIAGLQWRTNRCRITWIFRLKVLNRFIQCRGLQKTHVSRLRYHSGSSSVSPRSGPHHSPTPAASPEMTPA